MHLSEFEDYLDQFEESVKFDSETCPVCGIDLSSTIKVENSPFTEFITLHSEDEAVKLYNELVVLVPFNQLGLSQETIKNDN